ncbi:MAG TPA: hypothetical protein VMW25_00315 [Clostridia bacterium]|nr:hypothetical protein [Clostridia bacterium]
MQQHPVPAPITSYEFRLVGDMTLKQFAKLAAGCLLALLVYGVDPPGFVKWFLIFLFAGLGAAMAFLPFEGRPIDTWIVAFFKRIYSPTQYVWKQAGSKTVLGKEPPPPQAQASLPKAAATPLVSSQAATPLPAQPPPSQPIAAEQTIFKAPTARPIKPFARPKPLGPKVEAKFAPEIIIPAAPSIPNLLVGFVHDLEGKIIEGAILEIRDSSGNPVRAFKTNKLGQFRSATPLPPGIYEIEAEKEDCRFDIIKIELKGEILAPIEIVSK